MAETKPFFQRHARWLVRAAYLLAVGWFLWACAQFYLPGKGFTYLIMFGDRDAAHFIPELKALNHYEMPGSNGYDAQHYAQLAMHPQLRDPVLRDAIDSLPYRARRILFCWTAYALAFGDPARALQIYAVQNIACWLLLAALLLRWFPADSWQNFLRWAGVMFSFGLCFSVRGSLVDGPSLLLIAVGVALAESGRRWASALVLGVSGLGKETSVLAGTALWPENPRVWREWAQRIVHGALIVLPLALWLVTLKSWLGESMDAGYRNFASPFAGYVGKWREIFAQLASPEAGHAGRGASLMLIALTAQFLFFVLRPRWRETWWRVGIAFAALMMVLGEAVWEGYPGAASRVLLPMALAFNILVPRGRAWLVVLLAGNLTFLLAPETLEPPPRQTYDVNGPRALRFVAETGHTLEVEFDQNWFGPERTRLSYWRWSKGAAAVAIRNPQPFAIAADVSFQLRTARDRTVTIRSAGRVLWEGEVTMKRPVDIALRDVRLAPGENRLEFESNLPAAAPGNDDPREVAFSVRDLVLELKRRE